MPTNKQRREAAQRHLQRQLERRAELAQKRRRNLGIGLAALAAVVVVLAALVISGVFSGDDDAPEAAADAPTCDYVATDPSVNPNLTHVGLPDGDVPTEGTQALTMATSAGDIGLTLDRAGAPCAAAAITYLAEQGFFDGTGCHRLTTSPGLQVLQCGDPSETGRGGAAFDYPTAATGDETYPRGTVAMANSGQGFDGSQFFLVYGDSLEGNPNYTVVGTIDEAGLGVLDAIAAKGVADGGQDGAPAEPVTIESMALAG
ncbi:peptidylprolyl isomerase [Blastococcus sp. TML/M2B]|uniref:peptidylprolyl isomerase n=1 Tax=unclassified Blastococcus TaxID=2619396 RepID=UPI0019099502|nr:MULTISPECIES: peptidylprolyl isomerase [unclassified Blastococcus]MBN1092508.1 peptidylprolyl isomerase [Blastococcus sp. TML/M2B]MBN1097399.1 peptidylprolyl isomerase [Blastococcus sp. TML/C7B]